MFIMIKFCFYIYCRILYRWMVREETQQRSQTWDVIN